MGVVLLKRKLTSFQLIILGFSGVILFGTSLLMLPFSSRGGLATSFSDALFTSTSAVCVTGLIIHDTATYWSAFGQFVILLLIQIGGMGVITIAASFAMISGRKISLIGGLKWNC
jgi:trk system potassium uptake protein TrkH